MLREWNSILVAVGHDVRGQGEAKASREQAFTLFRVLAVFLKCVEELAPDDADSPYVYLAPVVLLH